MTGEVVVHGVHTLLWALEALSADSPISIDRLTAVFRRPVYPGDVVTLDLIEQTEDEARLRLNVGEVAALTVDVRLSERGDALPAGAGAPPADELAADLSIAEIAGASGEIAVPNDGGRLYEMFPHLVRSMGAGYPASLAAVSRLVGMVCPGRYSMLSALELATRRDGDPSSITWQVTRADDRVGAVRLRLSGGLVEGDVDSFSRPRPVRQPPYEAVARRLGDSSAFSGQRALVVGGSRGLGALSAKLISAGGGDTVITWHRGESEAGEVVGEIEQGGGRARSLHMDVMQPGPAMGRLRDEGWQPTHVYFFASPKIFARRTRRFEEALLVGFIDTYVVGLARVVAALADGRPERVGLFYPSTVAVSEPIESLTEYSVAKAAGEQAARVLARNSSWLTVLVERLPRVPTDQTLTLLPVEEADPMPLMERIVHEMESIVD